MDFYDINIELSRLHIEFIKQVKLYEYWSKKLTESTTIKDNSKKEFEEFEAYLDLHFREKWDTFYPNVKQTESSIKSAIKTDKEYQSKYIDYITSVSNYNAVFSMKNTLEQRKVALENNVKLYIAGYFTTQYVDKEVEEYFGTTANVETKKELEKNERMKKLKRKRRDV